MISLAEQYGRYGDRRVTELLRWEGWKVNHKRIERLWRREGLKVPKRQPKRRRLWLNDLFVRREVPDYIRPDNVSEFTALKVREWLERVEVKTLYIEPGSPWENRCVELFNGKLRDELLDREIFGTLLEATVLIEQWRVVYNTAMSHSSLG